MQAMSRLIVLASQELWTMSKMQRENDVTMVQRRKSLREKRERQVGKANH